MQSLLQSEKEKGKRKKATSIIFTFTFYLLTLCSTALAVEHITILHFNDLHGRIEAEKGTGGAAKIGGIIKKIRKENERFGRHTLVLNGGDLISGTFVSSYFKGEAEFKFLNAIKADALVLGNHDFDFGLPALEKNISGSTVLSANINKKEGGGYFVVPYSVINLGPTRVGILGLTTSITPIITRPSNVASLVFEKPIPVARRIMSELTKTTDLQIALTHQGVQDDINLARAVPQIDAVIGGHDHVAPDEYCRDVRDVPVCQTPAYGKYIGKIELEVDDDKVKALSETLIPIDRSLPTDRAVAEVIKPYLSAVSATSRKVVGTSKGFIPTRRDGGPSPTLGELVASLMREKVNAKIAFTNVGATRRSIPKGRVTRGIVEEAFPFDNKLVMIELTGREIESIIRRSITIEASGGGGEVLETSGISFHVRAGRLRDIKIDGMPIDKDASYLVATTDFLAEGGDGYTLLTNKPKTETDILVRDLFVDYLKTDETD